MTLYRALNITINHLNRYSDSIGLFYKRHQDTSLMRFIAIGAFVSLFVGWYYLYGFIIGASISSVDLLIGKPLLSSRLLWSGLGIVILAEALFQSTRREITAILIAYELNPSSSFFKNWSVDKPNIERAMRISWRIEVVGSILIVLPIIILSIKWFAASLMVSPPAHSAIVTINFLFMLFVMAIAYVTFAINLTSLIDQGESQVNKAEQILM